MEKWTWDSVPAGGILSVADILTAVLHLVINVFKKQTRYYAPPLARRYYDHPAGVFLSYVQVHFFLVHALHMYFRRTNQCFRT